MFGYLLGIFSLRNSNKTKIKRGDRTTGNNSPIVKGLSNVVSYNNNGRESKAMINGKTITIPKEKNITIQGDRVFVDGQLLELEYDKGTTYNITVQGDIQGDLKSDSLLNATIKGNVTGNVIVTNGDISCRDVGKTVTTTNGNIHANRIEGNCSTVNGDIYR